MLCISALDSDDFCAFMLCVYMVQLLYRIRKYDFSVCCNEGHDHCIHRLFSVQQKLNVHLIKFNYIFCLLCDAALKECQFVCML